MDSTRRKRLLNRRKLLFQQLELSVIIEKDWLKSISKRQLEAFRDKLLDEINSITRQLNQE